jgi:hypothetical protein
VEKLKTRPAHNRLVKHRLPALSSTLTNTDERPGISGRR